MLTFMALRHTAKVKAAIGKRVSGTANQSKPRLRVLCAQLRASARTYSTAELYKRGATGVCRSGRCN